MVYSSRKLALAVVFAMAAVVVAQNSPKDFLNPHNVARAAVGVEPVSWDSTVAAFAQSYAAERQGDCLLQHSPDGRPYGENIAVSGASGSLTAADAVALWVAEKQYYNHGNNSCLAPAGKSCLAYTQVVWQTSTAIGCARVVCDNNLGVFVICNYNPTGNFPGQSPY